MSAIPADPQAFEHTTGRSREVADSPLLLAPLLLFLGLFFGTGATLSLLGVAEPFYQLRAPVALLPALALGLWLARRRGLPALDTLLAGMGDSNIMLMLLIFLLAGAFSSLTGAIGAVDAVVALALTWLPASWVLPGIFIIAATLSLAIGTSMGTLAAVLPIAIGLADATGLDRGLVLGAVVGGAMFGDNLSVISDTTIAATRSQGAAMGDKFRENLAFALPAALATVVILALLGSPSAVQVPEAGSPWLALPYLLVLVLALLGIEVLRVLGIGLLAALLAGLLLTPGFGLLDASGQAYAGMQGMLDTLLVSVLVGGLAALAQAGGALRWLAARIATLARGRRSPRAGQVAIAALAAGTDAATANNTVAILVAGPLARELASTHGITPRRSAALLDMAACVVQGLMPYSAQILVAASLGAVSPLALVTQVHYCWLLGFALVAGLLLPLKPAPAPAIAAER